MSSTFVSHHIRRASSRIRRAHNLISRNGLSAFARFLRSRLRAKQTWRLISAGRYQEAVAGLEVYLRAHPDDLRAHSALGSAHYARGALHNAIAAFRNCMETQARLRQQAGVSPHKRYLTGYFTASIGHLALMDIVAKRQALALTPQYSYVVLAREESIANPAYLHCWRNHFEIIRDTAAIRALEPEAVVAEDYPTVLFLNGEWHWLHDVACFVENSWQRAGRGPLLELSDGEKDRARRTLGLPSDARFVTLHVRESRLRRNDRRNASIADYLPAIRRVTAAGGLAGKARRCVVHQASRDAAGVIDYVHGTRQDWLDVFLVAAPRFFVGSNSGPVWAAGTFGTPALLTNWAPMGIQSHHANTVTLPKLLWSESEKRHLSFAEQMAEPFAHAEANLVLETCRVRPIANSPEEISIAVKEMLLRAQGEWSAPHSDEGRRPPGRR